MTLLEKTLELAVGNPEDNLSVSHNTNILIHLHNTFMELSSDRFVKDVRKGDFRKIDKRKAKVLSGYSKIVALLSRGVK